MFVRAWVIPRVDAHAKIPALFIPMLYPLLWNMFNNVYASSLSEKMSSFMFVRAWVIPRVDAHAKIPALFIPMLYPLLWNMFNNVIFFVCARIGNTTYITFIMWNSISAISTD